LGAPAYGRRPSARQASQSSVSPAELSTSSSRSLTGKLFRGGPPASAKASAWPAGRLTADSDGPGTFLLVWVGDAIRDSRISDPPSRETTPKDFASGRREKYLLRLRHPGYGGGVADLRWRKRAICAGRHRHYSVQEIDRGRARNGIGSTSRLIATTELCSGRIWRKSLSSRSS
jgi:hypothetical protein